MKGFGLDLVNHYYFDYTEINRYLKYCYNCFPTKRKKKRMPALGSLTSEFECRNQWSFHPVLGNSKSAVSDIIPRGEYFASRLPLPCKFCICKYEERPSSILKCDKILTLKFTFSDGVICGGPRLMRQYFSNLNSFQCLLVVN